MILGEFPTLPLALIHGTIVFYLDNRQEVDEYLRRELEQVAEQRSQARTGPGLNELRERMKAMQHAQVSWSMALRPLSHPFSPASSRIASATARKTGRSRSITSHTRSSLIPR